MAVSFFLLLFLQRFFGPPCFHPRMSNVELVIEAAEAIEKEFVHACSTTNKEHADLYYGLKDYRVLLEFTFKSHSEKIKKLMPATHAFLSRLLRSSHDEEDLQV